MLDTTLAFSRIILSGFIDRYPRIKLIAAHGGATLPYLAGRLDRCHEKIPACASVIQDKPSTYLERIYYDTVVYDSRALELCIAVAGSPDNVLYGSDYPHNIGDMAGCLARSGAPDRRRQRRARVPAMSTASAIRVASIGAPPHPSRKPHPWGSCELEPVPGEEAERISIFRLPWH